MVVVDITCVAHGWGWIETLAQQAYMCLSLGGEISNTRLFAAR